MTDRSHVERGARDEECNAARNARTNVATCARAANDRSNEVEGPGSFARPPSHLLAHPPTPQRRIPDALPLPASVPRRLLLRAAVPRDADDGDRVPEHADDADGILKQQDGHDDRHRALRVPEHLQRQRGRALRDEEVGQVDAEREDAVQGDDEEEPRRFRAVVVKHAEGFGFHHRGRHGQHGQRDRRHVQQQVDGIHPLALVRQQHPLDHGLERATEGRGDAREKPEEMKQRLGA
eukprot:28446-Pelagococcus_subviridis.AAC.3